MSRILAIGTAVPPHAHDQTDILTFMEAAYHADPQAFRKLRFLHRHSGIRTRHSWSADFGANPEAPAFFRANGQTPRVDVRMQTYRTHALELARAAIEDCWAALESAPAWSSITHLIAVSCTGLTSPGLDIDLVQGLPLRPDVERTGIYFQGCNAAFPALRIADRIVRTEPGARVLVVCTELSTLHFQPGSSDDQLLANTLFADGAAAVLVAGDADPLGEAGIELKGFYSTMAAEGAEAMQWRVTPNGFVMTLTDRVPELVQASIADLVSCALQRYRLTREDLTHWALHPGGKNILQAVETGLSLSSAQLQASRTVLRDYGNMSSPSVLFVLKALMTGQVVAGEHVLAIGLGPGLSLETALLQRSGEA